MPQNFLLSSTMYRLASGRRSGLDPWAVQEVESPLSLWVYYDPSGGWIIIDGVNICKIGVSDLWSRRVCFCLLCLCWDHRLNSCRSLYPKTPPCYQATCKKTLICSVRVPERLSDSVFAHSSHRWSWQFWVFARFILGSTDHSEPGSITKCIRAGVWGNLYSQGRGLWINPSIRCKVWDRKDEGYAQNLNLSR